MSTKIPNNSLNRAKITFGYNAEIILPIKEGLLLMAQLSKAESIDSSIHGQIKVISFKEEINLKIISDFEYKEYKSAAILNPTKD